MEVPDFKASLERARPKLDRLLRVAKGKDSLVAQTHDYPDPDSIASALALCWLLEELADVETLIGYGGIIGRAENKAMIRVLDIKMRKTSAADFAKYDLVALLDTQPRVGNHSVPVDHTPDIVFDHHFPRELTGPEPRYFDVGGNYGATSTKLAELVIASGLTPPTKIATALFYGVKSDTLNLARDSSSADLTAYLYLFPLADSRLLAEIENPQVPLDYFRIVNKAIARAKIYGSMIVADLGEVYTPDLCAELADRLLQVEGIRHALAVAWYQEALFLSLRTRSRSKSAGKILHGIITGLNLGTAGGHGPMAGARISVAGKSQRSRADIRRKVISRVVSAFDQDYRHFQRVVRPSDVADGAGEPPPPRPRHGKEAKEAKEESRRPSRESRESREEHHARAALLRL